MSRIDGVTLRYHRELIGMQLLEGHARGGSPFISVMSKA
jgi:hypothetical protein